MTLLSASFLKKFPPLESTDHLDPKQVIVICKFHTPDNYFRWYPTEFDGNVTFFGFVRGIYNELGYFTTDQLHNFRSPQGLGVRRDCHFGRHSLFDVMKNIL